MAITYTNRMGEVYYLHQGQTKTGKPRYHFSKKEGDDLAETIPEGYEIHERPNAQVFLRKIVVQEVTAEEIARVAAAVRQHAGYGFRIDVEKDSIVVYEAAGNLATPMMRFVLRDKE